MPYSLKRRLLDVSDGVHGRLRGHTGSNRLTGVGIDWARSTVPSPYQRSKSVKNQTIDYVWMMIRKLDNPVACYMPTYFGFRIRQ